MKKILAIVLVVALTATVSIAGTMAYLTSTDSDVNVMTLGNVKIEQLEYERVVKDGAWVSADAADKYGYTPDLLQPFSQAKPLLPAVFADGKIKWDDRNGSSAEDGTGHQQSWGQVGASGSNQLFDDSVKNVQDKFVFVKNTGSTNAYVRTWIALEQGSVAAEDFDKVIMTNFNKSHWDRVVVGNDVVIDGNEYVVWCATYKGPKSNPTGILAPNATSYPSLLQVYMRPEATNADVAAIDGNGNGTYDILVFSQAVQVEGFADASTALTAAFGTNHPWTEANIPEIVDNAEDLADALAAGDDVVLIKDVDAGGQVFVNKGSTFDGAGNTIVVNSGSAAYESGLTVTEGTVKNVTVTGAYRGLGVGGSGASEMTGDATYENVVVKGATYGINIGVGNGHKLTVKDSTICNWNSYSGLSGAEFTGCTFTSQDGTYYAAQRISANATFTYTNCNFEQNKHDNASGSENYYLDSYGNGTIVFVNCYMDGVLITAENVNTLFQISPKNNTTVIVE